MSRKPCSSFSRRNLRTSINLICIRMDAISRVRRSANMRAVRSLNTKPELTVRRIAHKSGYRYRLHQPLLSCRPDIVFPRLRKIILVNGCFWHQHPNCRRSTIPKSNVQFWKPKLKGNTGRDKRNLKRLRSAGWRVLTIWECQIADEQNLRSRVLGFLR